MDRIIFLDKTKTGIMAPIFDGVQDTTVWSCLQGRNYARGWVDSISTPTCAAAMVGGVRPGTGGFVFFAGDAGNDAAEWLIRRWRNDVGGGNVIVPLSPQWENVIEQTLGEGVFREKRYSTSKSEHNFDRSKLAAWADSLPWEYSMRRIDRELFDACLANRWSRDNVGGFANFEEFVADGHGMGYAVMYDGQPVSVASPYSAYDKGIEIEIDTREDHRRRGLARACASMLILECLDNGLYPSWDAANPESIHLAQSLGYIVKEEYTAYWCDCGNGREG